MTVIDRKKITWYMNRLYRDITFTKDNVDRIKRYYTNRGDDRQYYVDTYKYQSVDNIKQLIRLLSKFY
jgi:hypothetical protein